MSSPPESDWLSVGLPFSDWSTSECSGVSLDADD